MSASSKALAHWKEQLEFVTTAVRVHQYVDESPQRSVLVNRCSESLENSLVCVPTLQASEATALMNMLTVSPLFAEERNRLLEMITQKVTGHQALRGHVRPNLGWQSHTSNVFGLSSSTQMSSPHPAPPSLC